ncbi:5'-deoxynucleotidase [Candidatus Enterovibrio escicola]|uniref:5'-deoxynucleotidase n=1 Tax=Candidatus Enterovibrio escicola TaxID=1927127 RepID=A0A2A5T0H5_9GAMM|nr:5'-deoxynucleotidase [Candidatus Enterovibrio escacola]PCS21646.1 Nucleotidase YfbR [Candidatus Enterovibrio escacola]
MSQQVSHFFAYLARMKLIYRWPLMRNVINENISEHSLQVAFVAHALSLIENKKFGGCCVPERVALLAMFHDCSEVLTGDLPTPIKYFNLAIADEYKKIERIAEDKLVSMLPEAFREDYRPLIDTNEIDQEEYRLVKQADAICAYLKCLEELSAGNHEFFQAKRRIEKTMEDRRTYASDYFMATFATSFSLSLDEISDEP